MTSRFVGKVKNNESSLNLIKMMRDQGLRVKLWGRHNDRKTLIGKKLSNGKVVRETRHVPIELSQEIAIYTY